MRASTRFWIHAGLIPGSTLVALLLLASPLVGQPGGGIGAPVAMNPMEHGPFISSTLTLDPFTERAIFAHKGIAVRVGPDAVMVFDTDLLRVAAAWTGGILNWRPARDGLEQFPTPDGHLHFLTAEKVGWNNTSNLTDTRGGEANLHSTRRSGPIGGQRRYEGLFVQGDEVVFDLTIRGARVLEKFGYARVGGEPIFTRTINVAPTEETFTLLVMSTPVGSATQMVETVITPGTGFAEIRSGEEVRRIGFRNLPTGAFLRHENGHLALTLPTATAPMHFQLSIGPVRTGGTDANMRTHLAGTESLDLTPFLEPGPAPYEPIETDALMAVSSHGPFVVDELVLPRANPWMSHLRMAAVDFLSDGRGVVASMSGDIWLVSGIQENLTTLTWQRFATGLNQPLGLAVVDDVVYVTGRDQITRLHDRNGDGYADEYENFNNQIIAGTNYHEFNLNLEVDSEGNFVWGKSTPWPPGSPTDPTGANRLHPHHGTILRVSPEGTEFEVIATGTRNPNGLSIGPNDEIYYSDNEGNWVPANKVTLIQEGEYHGFPPSAHRASLVSGWKPDDEWVKPLVWITQTGPGSDNSPAQARVITSPTWPESLQGNLVLASYGRGTMALILTEEVEGVLQGAHFVLPLEFESGLQHSRFHSDGHLYIVGMTNWQSTQHGGERGSFHRMRYVGGALHLPVAVNTRERGIELHFGEPLDPASAQNVANYTLTRWTYPWSASYGSQLYSIENPGEIGPDSVTVTAARLSEDGRSVFLEIPVLAPGTTPPLPMIQGLDSQTPATMGMVVRMEYDLLAADGTQLDQVLHKTIHRVPDEEGR